MKKLPAMLSLALLCSCASGADPAAANFRQVYDLNPEKVRQNTKRIESDLQSLPGQWKNAPALYYVTPPLSDVPRLPDAYPDDGIPGGRIEMIAAKGEFEPASLVIAPFKNVDKFTLIPSGLKSKSGAMIPASAIDVKLVKNWYQAGSGWYGFFADALGRMLVPELLLNDENMVRAVPATKDNYVRYFNQDGTTSYQWMSANFMVTNYEFSNQANAGLIADAATFQPAVLNKDEFKQFFLTLHVPGGAQEGLYSGKVDLSADGKTFASVPVSLRVLPFTLPAPKSNYDRNKGFYLCLYGTGTKNPVILKNMADHNALNPMGFPKIDVFEPELLKEDVRLAKEAGLNLRPIFSGSESVGLVTAQNPAGEQVQKLKKLKQIIQKTAAIAKKELGHTDFYSYGIDEGGPWTIRGERNAWKIAHDSGGKVMVSSYAHRELIFMLDYLILPGAPAAHRIREVNKFHESNPDSLCGWYANPHGGPENPDYFRRIHGYQAYKSNYDVAANYCWYRNNWNDMATPYEEYLRGIIMIYAGRDKTFDTLAWEGVREGLDDVKYASYLKDLALEASKSKDGNTMMLGRRVLSWLTYIDEERAALDTFRLECIGNILRLRNALKKGN